MSDVIIEADKLGKQYAIGSAGPRERYTALRDVLASQARGLVRRARRGLSSPAASGRLGDETFWALRDVSFEVKRGEAVGIIGRNGAGKSTLLKILSRITEPSAGRARLRGRVASLLEVGTGFHPELTGRENIFLNGAILGMTRAEIRGKFDQIVSFADVEKFLDTPVKRYSSGMYVRLAFAVAAHLDPEILVVDEVLAVGDAAFQKKCLGKMKDVASHGRTVLFVSHNMAAVRRLCGRGIVLEQGSVVKSGDAAEAVSFYLESGDGAPSLHRCWHEDTAPGNENIRLLEVAVEASTGDEIDTDSGFQVSWTFRSLRQHDDLGTTVEIRNQDDLPVIHDGVRVSPGLPCAPAVYQATMTVPAVLNAGRYRIDLLFGEQQRYLLLRVDQILNFEVVYRPSADRLSPPPGILKTCLDGNVHLVGN